MHRHKVDSQPAFVLHSYPYRETSLIVEVFSRDFGRVALMARGARRPRSALRGLLLAFQPLELAWAGKGEVLTLMKACLLYKSSGSPARQTPAAPQVFADRHRRRSARATIQDRL